MGWQVDGIRKSWAASRGIENGRTKGAGEDAWSRTGQEAGGAGRGARAVDQSSGFERRHPALCRKMRFRLADGKQDEERSTMEIGVTFRGK